MPDPLPDQPTILGDEQARYVADQRREHDRLWEVLVAQSRSLGRARDRQDRLQRPVAGSWRFATDRIRGARRRWRS